MNDRADPHVLAPGTPPTPFTADEIRPKGPQPAWMSEDWDDDGLMVPSDEPDEDF